MFAISRPDTTDEGWNSWPTEKVSHALVQNPRIRRRLHAHAVASLTTEAADVAALRLAPAVHELVEAAVVEDGASDLRASLLSYALSRVDWLQLAQAYVEAASPEMLDQAA